MKTIQISLDESLARELDSTVERIETTRSGFIRQALRKAVSDRERRELERRHREGYRKHPVEADEFDGWEDEQVWAD